MFRLLSLDKGLEAQQASAEVIREAQSCMPGLQWQRELLLSVSKALGCSGTVLGPVKLGLAGQVPYVGVSSSESRIRWAPFINSKPRSC